MYITFTRFYLQNTRNISAPLFRPIAGRNYGAVKRLTPAFSFVNVRQVYSMKLDSRPNYPDSAWNNSKTVWARITKLASTIDLDRFSAHIKHDVTGYSRSPDSRHFVKRQLLCMQCRLVLRRHIHKRTIRRGSKEETHISETTHVEQDEETPPELKESIQCVVDQFLAGKDPGQENSVESPAAGQQLQQQSHESRELQS